MNNEHFAGVHIVPGLSAILFPLTCLVPVVAVLFESSMALHMLVQLPLLILCGVILGLFNPVQNVLRYIDPLGYGSAIMASGWLIFWMLPMNLDAAQESFDFRLIKVVTLPLCLGLPACWAWRCLGGVGRGVLLLEFWAMLVRAGWIFVISREQICASYLPFEQRTVGMMLLQSGLVIAVIIVVYAFFRNEAPTTYEYKKEH